MWSLIAQWKKITFVDSTQWELFLSQLLPGTKVLPFSYPDVKLVTLLFGVEKISKPVLLAKGLLSEEQNGLESLGCLPWHSNTISTPRKVTEAHSTTDLLSCFCGRKWGKSDGSGF